SSTFSTGTCDAARDRPFCSLCVACSRPRLCGMETINGPGIKGSPSSHVNVVPPARNGRAAIWRREGRNFQGCRWFLRAEAETNAPRLRAEEKDMSIGTIILIILIIALLGGFSGVGGGPFYGTGYYGGGGLGLIVVILLILLLLGKL